MDIYVRVKAIGKRKDILAPTPYTIPDGICSLRQLLTAVVQKEVAQYNSKEAEAQLIPFLTQQELEDQAKIGKVSFGTIYSDKKADPGKAVANALDIARITVNKNMIPFDPEKPMITSGVRIGTAAVTTRGFGAHEMVDIAECIKLAATDFDNSADYIREKVTAICDKYPLYK